MSARTEPTTTPADGDGASEVAADPEPPTIGPSGWRRITLGLLVGLAAGALLALVLPRRRARPVESPGAGDLAPTTAVPATADPITPGASDPAATGADDADAAAR